MEPFLATAEALKTRGHEVVCAFPEQFQNLAEDSGISCHVLSKEFIELIGTEEGQIAMGGNISLLRKIQLYYRLYKKSAKINAVMLDQQVAIVKGEAVSDEQMIDIETKLAHQEYTIAELNDALSSQQSQISNLELMVTALRERIKSLSDMAPAGSDTDEVPPHY